MAPRRHRGTLVERGDREETEKEREKERQRERGPETPEPTGTKCVVTYVPTRPAGTAPRQHESHSREEWKDKHRPGWRDDKGGGRDKGGDKGKP